TRLSAIDAKMNEEINRVKGKYQDDITALQEQQKEPIEVLEVFANEQRSSWGKRRSLELLHAVIGFRTGMPKVSKSKKFTWEGITDLVKKYFPDVVRSKDELDKEGIIALSRDPAAFKDLKETCFLDIIQDEPFFVE